MLGMLESTWNDCQIGLVPHVSPSCEAHGERACVWHSVRSKAYAAASNGTRANHSGAWSTVEGTATVKDLLRWKRQIQHEMKARHQPEENMTMAGAMNCEDQENTVFSHSLDICNYLGYELEDFSASISHTPEHMDTVSPVHPDSGPAVNPSPLPTFPLADLPGHLHSAPTATMVHSSIVPVTTGLPCTNPPKASPNLPGPLEQQAGEGAPITTLFQWQIQQQLLKIKNISAEMISMQDSDGDTPLHIAVAQGKRALAYVLAAHMAPSGTLDLPEHNGQTALHIAAVTDQALIVHDLLEFGAQVHRRDTWGRSPLHVCVEKGHARSLQVRRQKRPLMLDTFGSSADDG